MPLWLWILVLIGKIRVFQTDVQGPQKVHKVVQKSLKKNLFSIVKKTITSVKKCKPTKKQTKKKHYQFIIDYHYHIKIPKQLYTLTVQSSVWIKIIKSSILSLIKNSVFSLLKITKLELKRGKNLLTNM